MALKKCECCGTRYRLDDFGLKEPDCECAACVRCGKTFHADDDAGLFVAPTDELAAQFGDRARCVQCWAFLTTQQWYESMVFMRVASYQKRIQKWIIDAFGATCFNSRRERAARVLEEALELAQAEGVDADFAAKIAARVYSRPSGSAHQEFAGVGVTLLAYADATDQDLDFEIGAELKRIESIDLDLLRAKHQEKVAAGTSTVPAVRPR